MNIKNNYVITLAFAALLFSGCKEGLNLIPEDSISDKTFWKTPDEFEQATNNLYYSLAGFNTWDTQTGMAFSQPNSISNGTYLPPLTNGNWNTPYIYIRRCNKIIAEGATSSITAEVQRWVGEAKFFRAYNYWRLFSLYGGVPLITKVLGVNDKQLYAARATSGQTVDFILKDLTDAAAVLPTKSQLSSADQGRITRGAALSLKARVALFVGTWEEFRGEPNSDRYLDTAIKASSAVMNSGQYSLYTGMGKESYRYLFIGAGNNCSGCILDRRYQVIVSPQTFPLSILGGDLLPTKKLADMYLCTDGLPITKSPLFQGYNTRTSEYENRDPRMAMTMLIPGTPAPEATYPKPVPQWPFYPQRNPATGYTTYKFMPENATNNSQYENGWNFDHHIIRYAEILLIYAEATFERNGGISDADLNKSINLIRQRVGMPPLTNEFVLANGLSMRQMIRRERTVELALEGFRYNDLRRWKTAEVELPQAIEGVKIVGTNWTDPVIIGGSNKNPYAGSSWQKKTNANGFIIVESAANRSFDPNKDYLLPIPTQEIALNPNLKQNLGW